MTKLPAFSLIELIVGITIAVAVVTLVSATSIDSSKSFTIVSTNQQRTSAFLDAFAEVGKYVRTGYNFPSSFVDPSTNTTYITGGTTLIAQQYALRDDNGLVDCNHTDTVVFSLDASNNLHEIIIADPVSKRQSLNQTIFPNVQSMTFSQTKVTGQHRSVTLSMTALQDSTTNTILSRQQTMVARND